MFRASLAHHQGVQMYKKLLGHTVTSSIRKCGGSGEDSMAQRFFCTDAPPDEGPGRPEICGCFVN
jgi:hypothetical protein